MKSSTVKTGSRKHWYDYLWAVSLTYLALGFFNIMFAWLGLICFIVPLMISIVTGSKVYCNRYCGRGQLFAVLGKKFHLSGNRPVPRWLKSKGFRYGFLAFFMIMFFQMLFNTWLVFRGTTDLKQAVTLLWTFRLPWRQAYHVTGLPLWTAQFAFGFYSVMLTSTILGLITMVLFKPRSWCVYCPMGTMTQLICQARAGGACPGCGSGRDASSHPLS
ncbi:MAG: 4Fe-4S binding protein [Clostridium sp.]|nr:4Fe-4S binding protein [Clostridium sp.]